MKRRRLLASIAVEAARQGKTWQLVRQGGSHEIWRCAGTEVSVPRHVEINEWTGMDIRRHLEDELGKGWWRR